MDRNFRIAAALDKFSFFWVADVVFFLNRFVFDVF